MSSGDNKVFNVNGDIRDETRLRNTLRLAMPFKAVGYRKSPRHGLIFYWAESKRSVPFTSPMTPDELVPMILEYLRSDEAEAVICEGWDENLDHEGTNGKGWRVYCEDWGHVDHEWQACIAVKLAWMWFGK